MNWINIFLIVGGIIIVVLSCIAIYLVAKVYRLNKQQQVKLKALDDANLQARKNQGEWLNKSIQILAQGLEENEMSLTEASIRISGLLDALGVTEEVKQEFSAFYQLREKTLHIPYLEAWQNLSAAEQNKFDLERIQQEAAYQDFVLDAAKRIIGRNFLGDS
jgi:Protein of unknown function (DUF2489)